MGIGFLSLFSSWWRRGKKEEKQPAPKTNPEPQIPPVLPPPTYVSQPPWLSEVQAIRFEAKQSEQLVHPTFFIGLGPTSLPVLEGIAHNLTEVVSNEQVTKVKFLHLDIIPESDYWHEQQRQSEASLTSVEQVRLKPDLQQYADRFNEKPESNYHLHWWQGNRPGEVGQDYDRAAARLGLFDNLQMGVTHSELWAKLKQGVSQLNTSVWIIASAADWVGSSLAFDMAHLARQTGGSGASVAAVSLVLLLQDISPADDVASTDETDEWRAARTFATFQELARFSHNRSVRFRYNPLATNQPILDSASASVRLVDDVYVVNAGFQFGLDERSQLDLEDRPREASSQQVIGALSDTLTALLSSPVRAAVQRNTDAIRSDVANKNQIRGDETYVMSLSCASYHIPFANLRQYAGMQLAYELLSYTSESDPLSGLLAEATDRLPNVQTAVSAWLRGEGELAPQHPLWSQIADLSENRPVRQPAVTAQNAATWFQIKLLEKVMAILNGHDRDLPSHGGRLQLAIRFCGELNGRLRRTAPRIPPGLNQTVEICQQWTRNLMDNLNQWDGILRPCVRYLGKRVKQERDKLLEAMQAPHHLVPETVQDIDGFYQRQVRAFNQPSRDMLAIGRRRLGWLSASGVEPSLQLGVIPLDRTQQQTQRYSLDDVDSWQTAVLTLGIQLTQQITQPAPANLLSDSVHRRQVANWLKTYSGDARTGGMLSIAADSTVLSQQPFILAPGLVNTRPLSHLLADEIQIGDISPTPLESLQAGSCSLIRIVGPIPLHSVAAYKQASQAFRQAPQAKILMAFEIEQLQVACRKRLGKNGRFSPSLYNALADIPLVHLFVNLASVGLIYQNEQQILLQGDRPILLDDRANWLQGLTAFTNALPIELDRHLRAESRVAFVQQLQHTIRQQENAHFAEAQRKRQRFAEITNQLLAHPENSDLWQLGVVFEHLLEQR